MIKKSMRSSLYFSLSLFAFFIFGDKSLSLTNYKINQMCERVKKESACIKNLKEKRSNLQKGKIIEIPVIPYKR